MRNKLLRAKTFAHDHPYVVSFGAAIAVGIIIGVITRPNSSGIINNVMLTKGNIQHLIDTPTGVVSFDVSPMHKIWVTNADSIENLL